ncbi:beclin-1-like protein [Adelges cooleyi]|uniref:beclin-1-like protein n=1 Tax=Adelges cooleyi TaxID=133065 RepID=UPI00218047C6|nr:beclin-1-like protein [Adelges cooleyi]
MSNANVNVNFACQRCFAPIRLDSSFNSISEHAIAELSLPIVTCPEVDLESQAKQVDHIIPGFHLNDSSGGNNGFTLLGEGETPTLSHQMKIAAGLFDIVSGNSQVNHPLCDECTDILMDMMDEELQQAEKDYMDYNNYLKELSTEEPEDMDALNKELEDLLKEEKKLMNELANLQETENALDCDIKEAEKEKERLIKEEERYWKEYSKHRRDCILIDDQQKSVECQISYTTSQLAKLRKTNVFNATFHIWHHGHFGTINKLRLGRLPSAPVDWAEINAAWGQVTLLLVSLARYMNLKFDKYRLVPYGNHSYVEVLGEKKTLPLYGQGGIRFVWNTKFDLAMVAFLDCLQQFKEEVEKGNSGFHLPYRMEKGKIEDSATGNTYNIRIQLNSEEGWTKALKFMLTNLKWGLAWVSAKINNEM